MVLFTAPPCLVSLSTSCTQQKEARRTGEEDVGKCQGRVLKEPIHHHPASSSIPQGILDVYSMLRTHFASSLLFTPLCSSPYLSLPVQSSNQTLLVSTLSSILPTFRTIKTPFDFPSLWSPPARCFGRSVCSSPEISILLWP